MIPFLLIPIGEKGVTPFHAKSIDGNGMIHERKAQSAVFGLLIILVLVVVAAGLVDIYRLYAARNWAYTVAQEAALTGASQGRDWAYVAATGNIRLTSELAASQAQQIVSAEMSARGVSGYTLDIRVLPDPTGGSIAGYPPRPVRLGSSLGNWSADEPAVGVFLNVPVNWLLLDRFGITGKSITVFASAGVVN
jgi:flagellin-like protein